MKAPAVFNALLALSALTALGPSCAATPAILLEACNAMEPARKRLECLRVANDLSRGTFDTSSSSAGAAPQSLYSPSKPRAALSAGRNYAVGGRTCYVGPRGGTYTITASGRKNYNGC